MSESSSFRLLFDADILIKLSIFNCFIECIEASGLKLADCATMKSMARSAGVDHPTIRDQKAGVGKPARRLFSTLKAIPTIDKMTEAEKVLSAEINAVSQEMGLQVDGGEIEPVPIAWTPRSAKSVIHGRPVRSLATNREPAGGG